MSNLQNGVPMMVSGHRIGCSAFKTLLSICGYIILTLFGLFLLWLLATKNNLTWWGTIVGVVSTIGGAIMLVVTFRQLLVRRQLILGKDCFQVTERLGGHDEVVVHIPYANIADVKYEYSDSDKWVDIDLQDPHDPRPYTKSSTFESNYTAEGHHYFIRGGYKLSLKEIARLLQESRTR